MPDRVDELPPANWLVRRFGSRGGLLRSAWHGLVRSLGGYRRYRDIDLSRAQRLVFVCKGNICRSAFAEKTASGRGWDSSSCGIDTVDDATAEADAVAAAGRLGIDLSAHRTTRLQSLSLLPGDLLVAMEPWQAHHLRQHCDAGVQVTLLGLWGGGYTPHIEDPYGFHAEYFDHCFDRISKALDGLLEQKKQAER